MHSDVVHFPVLELTHHSLAIRPGMRIGNPQNNAYPAVIVSSHVGMEDIMRSRS